MGTGVAVFDPRNVAIAADQLTGVLTPHSVDCGEVLPATKYPPNRAEFAVTPVKAVCPIGPDVGTVKVFFVNALITSSGAWPSTEVVPVKGVRPLPSVEVPE